MPRKQKRFLTEPLEPSWRVHIAAFPDRGRLTAGQVRPLGTSQSFGTGRGRPIGTA
jgi:hypothetical protein